MAYSHIGHSNLIKLEVVVPGDVRMSMSTFDHAMKQNNFPKTTTFTHVFQKGIITFFSWAQPVRESGYETLFDFLFPIISYTMLGRRWRLLESMGPGPSFILLLDLATF